MAIEGPISSSTVPAGAVGTTQLANDAVTYAKIQNVSATDKLLGRSTAGAGDVEEITCTSFGRSLIDDTNAASARTTLGLGDAATGTVGTDNGTKILNVSGGNSLYSNIGHAHVESDIVNLKRRFEPPKVWYRTAVAISLSDDPLSTRDGGFITWPAPRAGSIVAVTAVLSTPITAGSISINAQVGGSDTALTLSCTSGSNESGGTATQAAGLDTYSPGNLIGAAIYSDAGLLPAATINLEVFIEIEEAA